MNKNFSIYKLTVEFVESKTAYIAVPKKLDVPGKIEDILRSYCEDVDDQYWEGEGWGPDGYFQQAEIDKLDDDERLEYLSTDYYSMPCLSVVKTPKDGNVNKDLISKFEIVKIKKE
jgi:hypothetical protein